MLNSSEKQNTEAFQFNIGSAPKLREISSPFMKNYGISGICYFRYFKDGRILRLGTIDEWTRRFFQLKLFNSKDGDHSDLIKALENKEHIIIQTGIPEGEVSHTLFELGIWNSCGLFRNLENSIEAFFLAGKKDDSRVINFFLNEREMVNHFILYIKDQMKDEICKESGYINSNIDMTHLMNQCRHNSHKSEIEKKALLVETPIKHYHLTGFQGDIVLTPREYQVTQLLSSGLTCKEIAKKIGITHRTVETFVSNVKFKTGCITKSELIKIFEYSGLNDKFLDQAKD